MARYEGTRWKILYGSRGGVERFALDELQRMVQLFQPYVISIEQAGGGTSEDQGHLILVGTADNNPLISELIGKGLLAAPEKAQGYSIACFDSPWAAGRRVIAIAGFDPSGVLYGVEDFNSRILSAKVMPDNPVRMRECFDKMRDFRIAEYPLIEDRGIWTWGYVIYDYRRFIDNMARLKMNMLTIWNDCVPLNAAEVVDYAHSRGVKIVMGFHLGWGIPDLDPTNPEHLKRIKDEVVCSYKTDYHHLGIDGIYFQTFTETTDTEVGGRRIASLACEWVNEIAAALYEIDPDLHIQFGLHATSIVGNYHDLEPLDPRVTITWEDAGVLPYSYEPVLSFDGPGFGRPDGLFDYESTLAYSKKLVDFRENHEFAIVPKGFINLRWESEFENHGPFILGERDAEWIRSRREERRPRWDQMNTRWVKHNPYAARFYREILDCSPSRTIVTALIEDGMFEESIELSAAIFAETIWNPTRPDEEILELAMSPYYRRG